ncbi:uncharacterized protein [Drosophila kikkawai]|uniref:Uncharacterized protein n=1 Tax=Drosophila kikkawai TaxID=30033 RepID=A0A6P4J518_DROKI|nr:uncharacterized protein LOC108080303 [Drosophila kikkawai]
MGNKRRREDTSSETSDSEDMLVPSCSREACQRRFPDQELRDRRRRRIFVHRRQKRRYTNVNGNSSASEAGQTERIMDCRRRLRFKNSHLAAPAPSPEPDRASEEDNKWHDIVFAALAVVLVILFMETYIATWFVSYLCGIVACCTFCCLFMMPKNGN